jgi:serine/threonine protein kinase
MLFVMKKNSNLNTPRHLRHPNIVLFMGACIEPTNLAMVTEYLPRGDIHNLIHNSQLSKAKILQMACDVIEGMTWLHNSKPPIIHRDIKPNNLLV